MVRGCYRRGQGLFGVWILRWGGCGEYGSDGGDSGGKIVMIVMSKLMVGKRFLKMLEFIKYCDEDGVDNGSGGGEADLSVVAVMAMVELS